MTQQPADIAFIILYILLVGVSNFSIYFIVRHTNGPFDVFYKFRQMLGYVYLEVYDDSDSIVDIVEEPPTENFFGKLFDCPWCSSTWYCLLAFVPLYFQYHVLIVFMATFVSVGLMNIIYENYSWRDTQQES